MRIDRFSFSSSTSVQNWISIGDRVMGGVSYGRLRFDDQGFAVFEGTVSFDHGGGFASVRHSDLPLGTPDTVGYGLRVRGDGKRYKFNLGVQSDFDAVQYQAGFTTIANSWIDVELPLSSFEARLRGRPVAGQPALAPDEVCQVGLMISERQQGPFELDVQRIVCLRPAGKREDY